MRDHADGDAGVFVLGLGLRDAERLEGLELAVVEARVPAVPGEVDGGEVDAVEFGEGADGVAPPGGCVRICIKA